MHWLRNLQEEARFHRAAWRYRLRRRVRPVRVLVNGSPKTGTTWMVRLLASLPGQRAVGNFRGRIGAYEKLAPGAVVHAHDPLTDELVETLRATRMKVVLMLRDPRDQIVSRMFHIRRDPTHRWHRRFREMPDHAALSRCIDGADGLPGLAETTRWTRAWLDARLKRCLCVRYEDLLAAGHPTLRRVFAHLEIPAPDELVRAVLQRNRFERLVLGRRWWRQPRAPGQEDPLSHFRKGVVGDWRNHFRKEHVERFREIAGQTLVDWGYESDPSWS